MVYTVFQYKELDDGCQTQTDKINDVCYHCLDSRVFISLSDDKSPHVSLKVYPSLLHDHEARRGKNVSTSTVPIMPGKARVP